MDSVHRVPDNDSASIHNMTSITSFHSRFSSHQWMPSLEGSLPMKPTGGDPLVWTSFDVLAIMLHSIFQQRLKVPLNESHELPPVIVVQSPITPESYQQRLIQIMFETHRVTRFAVISQPIMTLYAMGRQNGIVIDSGDDSTTISPVYCGRVLTDAVCTLQIGGRQLTEYMIRLSGPSEHQYPQQSPSQMVLFVFSVLSIGLQSV